MKLLPENPTQFDYLHAIRAIASRVGNVDIFELADAGMQLDEGKSFRVKCERTTIDGVDYLRDSQTGETFKDPKLPYVVYGPAD